MPLLEEHPSQKLEVVLKKPIIERIGSFLWGMVKIFFVIAIIGIFAQSQKISKEMSASPLQSTPINSYFQEEEYNDSARHVGVLSLSGEILNSAGASLSASTGVISSEETISLLAEMAKNEKLDAILLRIDSPGGEVLAAEKIATMITGVNAKKPVYILMETIAASGGYYISAPATKIYAYPETLLGNIGVRMEIPNLQGLLGKVGVEMQLVKSGELKDMGSPYRPMTEKERGVFDALIAESYEQFLQVVAKGRNLPIEKVKTLADGRIYSGRQAKENGLVDDTVSSLGDLSSLLQKELGNGKALQFIEYRKNFTPWEQILMSVSSWGSSLDVSSRLKTRFLAE